MNLYQPTITGSLSVSGSVNISGSISIAGGGTISGTASIATTALTASSADNLLVRNTLTAQTLVVQTITSSVDFVTGSTRFGSLLANTHVFSGSVTMNPGGLFVSSSNKVGIGTTNPDNSYQGLTIFGTDPSLRLKTSNASGWTWIEFVNSSGTNNFSMGVNQTTPFFGIKAGAGMDSPNFAINSSGNVGIGTTTIYSGAKLHILGGILAVEPTNGNTNSEILIGRGLSSLGTSAGSGITAKINFAFEGSNDNFYQELGFVTTTANQTRINSAADFYISTKAAGASSPSEKFRITSGGNVGIGTSTIDRLTVSRNVADNSGGLTLYNENNQGYGSAISFRVNYAGVYNTSRIHGDWDTGNSGALHFFTANTSQTLVERMTITGGFSVSVPNNTATTLFNIASVLSNGSIGIVCVSNATNGIGQATLIIMKDGNGNVSQAQIGTQPVANYFSFSLSGTNLQIFTAISAGTFTIAGSIVRISS
jgi:hypothetical protein